MTTSGFFVCSRLVTWLNPGFLQNCHALRREMDDDGAHERVRRRLALFGKNPTPSETAYLAS
jgi:hypothetical protein